MAAKILSTWQVIDVPKVEQLFVKLLTRPAPVENTK